MIYNGTPSGTSAYWNTATSGAANQVVLANTPPYLTVRNGQGTVR